ncbi:tandem-type lipoprotein [Staphylococcus hyicus]|nr:tandem-type lipoprotein [Staphylococcus hyicus]MDP4449304.1 tandem-type lipoprotein [Staphylococcus hyicus]NJH80583.1 tandem-type lipoprotein [Staphylococcus hyicus]NJH99583.1 tandem-type lipoprotein [Staphylococcus hyicus]NJI31372.1 tandem-type lipoprotein [Staphylococcus hyicus]
MKLAKHLLIILGVMVSMSLLSSCGMSTREKIESGLKEPLSVYPTKNLEDFYDKEGYRDSSFSKDDKGVWSVYTSIATRNDEGKLKTEGVILFIDRNTRTSKGNYFVQNDSEYEYKKFKKEYPIIMKDNKLILREDNVNEEIKRKVEKFKFFVQFGELKELDRYLERNAIYNNQAPNYLMSYYIKNNDKNLKQIQSAYGLNVGEKPRLEIYGDGELKNNSKISANIEYILNDKKDRYVDSEVIYLPKRGLKYE